MEGDRKNEHNRKEISVVEASCALTPPQVLSPDLLCSIPRSLKCRPRPALCSIQRSLKCRQALEMRREPCSLT